MIWPTFDETTFSLKRPRHFSMLSASLELMLRTIYSHLDFAPGRQQARLAG